MTASREARPATAIEAAISAVAARSLTEKKLREILARRYDESEIDGAIARLRELRLVDDAAWAERFARGRAMGGKGRHRIQRELIARGIDAGTAEAALDAAVDRDSEREAAAKVLATLRARLHRGRAEAPAAEAPAANDPESRRAAKSAESRLFRAMIARGYPASLVRDLLGVS